VGSAIAASLAGAGVMGLGLFDARPESAQALAGRIRRHYPAVDVATGSNDPAGYDVVVNATPLGMAPGDPLPVDVDRIRPGAFVGEVVMAQRMTPFLRAVAARGPIQVGSDMLFEQIPAYLDFFGFGAASPEELRDVAQIG
jgi:shikimate dehydrogenase